MFVTIQKLNESKELKTVQDCVDILVAEVKPRYPRETTPNPLWTKSECFIVLRCFFDARKLSPRLTPYELEKAVAIFLDMHLWISPEENKAISVQPNFDPVNWFSYPLSVQLKDIFRLYAGLTVNFINVTMAVGGLLLTDLVRLSKHIKYKIGFVK